MYSAAVSVDSAKDMLDVLKQADTKTYVYVMIADGEIIVLGEGTGNRGFVMFPGRAAPAHLKAITAALADSTADVVERIVIPTPGKEASIDIERCLFKEFNFHDVSVDQKNELLLEKRLKQLGGELSKETKVALMPLLYATGTDMGTFKKYKHHLPGDVLESISEIFDNYYTDI